MGNLGKIGKPQKSKKHKKLKPVDPFNRGGRQAAAAKAAKGTDKTPKASQIDDQDMTRSMRDFIRSKKMVSFYRAIGEKTGISASYFSSFGKKESIITVSFSES